MSIPESDFKGRIMDQGFSDMASDKMYKSLWAMVVDARSKFFKTI